MKQNQHPGDNTYLSLQPADSSNPISALQDGLAHEVDDIVKLELTAEQMLQDEAQLVFNYVATDAKHFWADIKGGLLKWELTAGDLLLSAADPTSVEWKRGQWWDHESYINHQLDD